MMTHHWRYALWLILPGVVLLVAMWTNPHVTDQYHVQRVMPFIAMGIAKVVLIVVLIVQHPNPKRGVSRWAVWRWLDPLTLLLIAMLAASALYFVLLWGGNSQQFRAPTVGYDISRALMLIDGYILISVGCELLYRGIRSRRDERMRRLHRYDVQDGSKKGDVSNG